MTVFTEGSLEITFNGVLNVRKFDDHGLTCMKAVDFLVELPDCYLFIEFKDPESSTDLGRAEDYVKMFKRQQLDQEFKYKYRDSFLYELAGGQAQKDCYYYVLFAWKQLTKPQLLRRTNALQQALPIGLHHHWSREIVKNCGVFNIATWNSSFPNYPVRRI